MRELEIIDELINNCWSITSHEKQKEYVFHVNNLKKYLKLQSDDYKAFIESEIGNERI